MSLNLNVFVKSMRNLLQTVLLFVGVLNIRGYHFNGALSSKMKEHLVDLQLRTRWPNITKPQHDCYTTVHTKANFISLYNDCQQGCGSVYL